MWWYIFFSFKLHFSLLKNIGWNTGRPETVSISNLSEKFQIYLEIPKYLLVFLSSQGSREVDNNTMVFIVP